MAECPFVLCTANVETVIEQEIATDDEGVLLRVGMHDIECEGYSGPCPGSLMHSPPTRGEAEHLDVQREMISRIIADRTAAKPATGGTEDRGEHSKTPHPGDDKGWFSSPTAPRGDSPRRLPMGNLADGRPTGGEPCTDPDCNLAPFGPHTHGKTTKPRAATAPSTPNQGRSNVSDAALDQLRALTALAIQGFENTTGAVLVTARELNTVEALVGELRNRAEGAATVARAAVGDNNPPQPAQEMIDYAAKALSDLADVEAAVAGVREALAAVSTNAGAAKVSGEDYLRTLGG